MQKYILTEYGKAPVGSLLKLSKAQAEKRSHLLEKVKGGLYRVITRPVGFFEGETLSAEKPLGRQFKPVEEKAKESKSAKKDLQNDDPPDEDGTADDNAKEVVSDNPSIVPE